MISLDGASQFSTPQRSLIFRALDEAEQRTTRYYCIPPFRWQRLRYDLLTRADSEWEPLPGPVFARTRCLESVNRRRAWDFYRIELNDGSILAAAEREYLLSDPDLYPFIVYILTHEMVHLVRLSTILDSAINIEFPFVESEEHRVQSISRCILKGSSNFLPVLNRFCT
jgi:hypothetical protein